jgi:hypothetical protein
LPNLDASSAAIDFVTALGRLLRDRALRDAFAADPLATATRLGLRASDQPAFARLIPAELEFQAEVLLRKRFDSVRRVLPNTCRGLSRDGWREFHHYSQATGVASRNDSHGFCEYLTRTRPAALCPLERNRCRFVRSGRRWAVHVACASRGAAGRRRPILQLFLGARTGQWHEWHVSIGF